VQLLWEMLLSGFKGCGIFSFIRNQLHEHVFFVGTVHVHTKVTDAEVAPQVTSESQATEASDKTAPETQEVQMTPSSVSAARRRFEDISSIPSMP
jgi:hypothetical protein